MYKKEGMRKHVDPGELSIGVNAKPEVMEYLRYKLKRRGLDNTRSQRGC